MFITKIIIIYIFFETTYRNVICENILKIDFSKFESDIFYNDDIFNLYQLFYRRKYHDTTMYIIDNLSDNKKRNSYIINFYKKNSKILSPYLLKYFMDNIKKIDFHDLKSIYTFKMMIVLNLINHSYNITNIIDFSDNKNMLRFYRYSIVK